MAAPLFEFTTQVPARMEHDGERDRDAAIEHARSRAVQSGWTVERLVSFADQPDYSATVTLLVHQGDS